MTDTRSASSTKVEHLLPGSDPNIIQTAKNTCSQLAPEWIPHTVFDLDGRRSGIGGGGIDGYPLFAINALAWNEVLGDEELVLAFCDEDAGVSVRLENDLGTSLRAASSCTTAGTTTSRCTSASATASTL